MRRSHRQSSVLGFEDFGAEGRTTITAWWSKRDCHLECGEGHLRTIYPMSSFDGRLTLKSPLSASPESLRSFRCYSATPATRFSLRMKA